MVVLVKLSNEWALVHLMFYIYCLLIVEWNNEKMEKIYTCVCYVQNSRPNFWNSVTYIKKKWWRLLFVKCILFLNSTMSILLLLYNLQFIFSCWVPCSLSRYLVCTCSLTPCLGRTISSNLGVKWKLSLSKIKKRLVLDRVCQRFTQRINRTVKWQVQPHFLAKS